MKPNEIVEKLKDVQDGEYVLRSQEEEQEYLKNYAASEVDKKIGDRIKELHSQYDRDIEEATGKKKPDGVKSYEFVKDVLKGYKEKADSAYVLEKQIEDLNKKIRENTGDETLKAQYKTLEKKHKEALESWQGEKENLMGEFNKYKVRSALDNSLAGVKFKKDLPEAVVKSYVDTVKNDMMGNAVFNDDGDLIFKKDDTVLVDKQTLKPLSAKEILIDKLKDIVETGSKTGTGSKTNYQTQTGEIVPPDSAMVNKDTLAEYLQNELIKKGMTRNEARNSKEYLKLFGEYSNKLT